MITPGPGENDPASWTDGKESLLAEDFNRSLVSCMTCNQYFSSAMYIIGEYK
jgi:hypothetical protein